MKYTKTIIKNTLRRSIDAVIYLESFFHKKDTSKVINDRPQKRVLIMRKDGLGDCIIFYPTLKAYRDYYKDAEITLIFPTYFRDLTPLLSADLVDKVIWFDHKLFGSSYVYRRKFLIDLKKSGYDVFIYPVFSRETIGYFMMKMTGAKEKISFDGDISEHGKISEKIGTLKYTRLIRPPEDMKSEIMRDIYFTEQVTGQKIDLQFPTIDTSKLSNNKAQNLLKEFGLINDKYVVIFPGAGAHYRIWMLENFAEVADYFVSKNITPVICGSPKENELVTKIISKSKDGSKIINLAGKTDLATLAHVLKTSKLYFGSDTGILHLAVAVGTPAIGIMGSGGLNRFFPYGDLSINRIIYDKTHEYITGAWTDVSDIPIGEIHPSIKNITLEGAKKEIDYLLQYLA